MKSIEEARAVLEKIQTEYSRPVLKELKDYLDTEDAMNTGYLCFDEAILSLPTYKKIRELLESRKERTIIVDCGCGWAIQQLLFKDFYKYVGIDVYKVDNEKMMDNRVLQDNTVLYTSATEEILSKVVKELKEEIERDCIENADIVGVSLLCHAYFGGDGLDSFKENFNYMVCI